MRKNFTKLLCLAAGSTGLLVGCETMDTVSQVGTAVAVSQKWITTNQAVSINRSASAVGKTFDDITPKQEYYIGRAVMATVMEKYQLDNEQKLNHYVNLVGQTLAKASDCPSTYGGYHFAVMNSEEINAFAAPGGLIVITKGLLGCCRSEDELAAVLAHEIGHVEHKDGLRAISNSRITTALTIMAVESAKNFGGQDLADLTKAFEGSVSDVINTMVVNGYSRQQEFQADLASVTIMRRVGYNPNGLINVLETMKKKLHPGGADFAKTHPDPAARIVNLQKIIGPYQVVVVPPERQARFNQALSLR